MALGPQLVSNYSFDDGQTDWSGAFVYWSLFGGSASMAGDGEEEWSESFQQSIDITTGKIYEVEFQVIAIDNMAALQWTLGGITGIARSVAGIFTQQIEVTNENALVMNGGYSGVDEEDEGSCSIGYISVKEVDWVPEEEKGFIAGKTT